MTRSDEPFLLMSDRDNVAVAKRAIPKGASFYISGRRLKTAAAIPAGNRFAIADIKKGEEVRQYSFPFGVSKGIRAGALITAAGISEPKPAYSKLLKDFARNRAAHRKPVTARPSRSCERFLGYRRKGGGAGTRNYYVLVPTSLCASDVAHRAAEALDRKRIKGIDGVVAAAHTEGCGSSDGVIIDRMLLTLKNTILNPNVCGALVIDLGCEKISSAAFLKYLAGETNAKPVDRLSIQACGGTRRAVEAAEKLVLQRLRACTAQRESMPVSKLVIGTECGASDTFSGITANPLIGKVVDELILAGGSAILSETPEMLGAEEMLVGRMASAGVARKFIAGIQGYKHLAQRLNVSMSGNFVPGNERGGLINPTLKSLGAVLKGGTGEIVDFLDYSERISRKGLSLMNGPGNDLESVTGVSASGANIFLFSTGGGATEGALTAPVIKIASNSGLFKRLDEDMDFNAGELLDGTVSFGELSSRLFKYMLAVASGKKTWAERWKKRPFQIWTAGKLSL